MVVFLGMVMVVEVVVDVGCEIAVEAPESDSETVVVLSAFAGKIWARMELAVFENSKMSCLFNRRANTEQTPTMRETMMMMMLLVWEKVFIGLTQGSTPYIEQEH